MEEKYMQVLENTYQEEQSVKQLKKINIKASIRIIQKAWRRYFQRMRVAKALTIQQTYKNYKKNQRQKAELKEKLMDKFFVPRLQHRLKYQMKLKHSRKELSEDIKTELLKTHQNHLPQLIKIQSLVRLQLACCRTRKLRMMQPCKKRHLDRSKIKSQRGLYACTSAIDSELVRRIGYAKLEIASIDKYLSANHTNFDQNWDAYEQKLEHYCKHEKEFEDWHETTDEMGTKYWVNHKTLKKSKKHPGIMSFKVNKRKLKEEAEEEQKLQISVVEHMRKRFLHIIAALLKQRNQDLAQKRTEYLQKIMNNSNKK